MSRLPSVMAHDFSRVPSVGIQRSTFDRSFTHKTTFDAGYLIPVFVDEALPGDTFKVDATIFARLCTPVFPIMDNLFMDLHFFAVPNRLVWNNWQALCGEQIDPDPLFPTPHPVPEIDAPAVTGFVSGSLFDYMGFPTGVAGLKTYGLFHRAYNLIYNEWYRDENAIDSVVVDKDDGPDDPADYVLLKRAKRRDYFTSCLPWPQKGLAVELPLGVSAPVKGIGSNNQTWTAGPQTSYETGETAASTYASFKNFNFGDANQAMVVEQAGTSGFPNIYADLRNATAANINDLRQAFQIQRLLERDARGGSRFAEILRSHFNVVSPDARLQRPEVLSVGTVPVNVAPIAQTSAAAGQPTPQGNLAGMGIAHGKSLGFTKSFVEHSIVIGIISVRSDLTYQQGLPRMYSRQTRYDFFWPALSHIGEQAVLNKEIYCDGTSADDDIFGYQERYAEYRYKPSMITGLFRTAATGTLDSWHLSQSFAALPVLTDQAFLEEDPPMARVKAVGTEPDFKFDSYFRMHCTRPMPMYGVPGYIDHF